MQGSYFIARLIRSGHWRAKHLVRRHAEEREHHQQRREAGAAATPFVVTDLAWCEPALLSEPILAELPKFAIRGQSF